MNKEKIKKFLKDNKTIIIVSVASLATISVLTYKYVEFGNRIVRFKLSEEGFNLIKSSKDFKEVQKQFLEHGSKYKDIKNHIKNHI